MTREKMSEAEAQQRFVAMLEADGWTVTTNNPGYADVIATKTGEPRLIAEVKGHTAAPGLDVNTMYGQILNRMDDLSGNTRYAIVVPESILDKVERVTPEVRALLKLETWVVPAEGDPYRA
jgi:hypothetical protein